MGDMLTSVDRLFTLPHDQIVLLRLWNNEYDLGFKEKEIMDLWKEIPQPGTGLIQPVIEICLESVGETVDKLWLIICDRQVKFKAKIARWEGLFTNPELFRLREGINWQKGLRWKKVDLGANVACSSDQVRAMVGIESLPHVAVLSMGALSPLWVQNMKRKIGDTFVPFVEMAGFEICVQYCPPWSRVLTFCFDQERNHVALSVCKASEIGYDSNSWCVPVFTK
ncbi:MAG: hypothetical protein AAB453_03870 [Patescibacteria group bacterium]